MFGCVFLQATGIRTKVTSHQTMNGHQVRIVHLPVLVALPETAWMQQTSSPLSMPCHFATSLYCLERGFISFTFISLW